MGKISTRYAPGRMARENPAEFFMDMATNGSDLGDISRPYAIPMTTPAAILQKYRYEAAFVKIIKCLLANVLHVIFGGF